MSPNPLEHHPIADQLPRSTGDRFDDRVRDLQSHGSREPDAILGRTSPATSSGETGRSYEQERQGTAAIAHAVSTKTHRGTVRRGDFPDANALRLSPGKEHLEPAAP